jgi:hypothetical protein
MEVRIKPSAKLRLSSARASFARASRRRAAWRTANLGLS